MSDSHQIPITDEMIALAWNAMRPSHRLRGIEAHEAAEMKAAISAALAAAPSMAVSDDRDAFEFAYAAHAIEYVGLDDSRHEVQQRLKDGRDGDRYKHIHDSGAWVGWKLARAALAATPENDELDESREDLFWKLHSLSKSLESRGLIDQHDQPEAYAAILDAMKLVRQGAAAAPVVLPEPAVIALSKRESATKGTVEFTWGMDAFKIAGPHALYTEQQLRALLSTAPALRSMKVTEEMHVAAVKVLQRASGLDGLPQRMLDAMVAVAPAPADALAIAAGTSAQVVKPSGLLTVDEYQAKYLHIHKMSDDERYGYECLYNEIVSGLQIPNAASQAQALPINLIEAINTACRGNEWQGDALATDLLEPACRAIASLAHRAQADARDAIRELIAKHSEELEHNAYAYFELAYTRRTGWMAWITDKPLNGGPVINPDRKVLCKGQGDTPEEACSAAIAAAKGEQQS